MLNSELIPILQMSVVPAIVISGVGLLLLSMTNRYGRVIDRSRQLAEAVRSAHESDYSRLSTEITILMRRARMIRSGIALASVSVLFAAMLVISLFLMGLFKWECALLCAILFSCSMGALVLSLIWFLRDINVSLHALEVETSSTAHRLSQRMKVEPNSASAH